MGKEEEVFPFRQSGHRCRGRSEAGTGDLPAAEFTVRSGNCQGFAAIFAGDGLVEFQRFRTQGEARPIRAVRAWVPSLFRTRAAGMPAPRRRQTSFRSCTFGTAERPAHDQERQDGEDSQQCAQAPHGSVTTSNRTSLS